MPSGVRVRFAITTSCEPSGNRAMIAGGRACRTYSVPPFFVATVSTLHQVAITVVVLAESIRRPAAAEPFPTDYLRLRENFVNVLSLRAKWRIAWPSPLRWPLFEVQRTFGFKACP